MSDTTPPVWFSILDRFFDGLDANFKAFLDEIERLKVDDKKSAYHALRETIGCLFRLVPSDVADRARADADRALHQADVASNITHSFYEHSKEVQERLRESVQKNHILTGEVARRQPKRQMSDDRRETAERWLKLREKHGNKRGGIKKAMIELMKIKTERIKDYAANYRQTTNVEALRGPLDKIARDYHRWRNAR